jgi:hypothetical protein
LFTLIKLSLKSSTTLNNVPFVPSVLNTVAPEVVEFTCNLAAVVVVPIPMFPLLEINNLVALPAVKDNPTSLVPKIDCVLFPQVRLFPESIYKVPLLT